MSSKRQYKQAPHAVGGSVTACPRPPGAAVTLPPPAVGASIGALQAPHAVGGSVTACPRFLAAVTLPPSAMVVCFHIDICLVLA